MNKSNNRDDNDKAAELEAIHEQLMERADAVPNTPRDDADTDEFVRAREMLVLLERARRDRLASSNQTLQETSPKTNLTTPIDGIVQHDANQESVDRSLPTKLGRFEVIRQLGRGGYGVVFLARDPELNRQVAVKVPRPEAITTNELVERFVREAKAAAALSHPNIVPVFEAGRTGPILYIASEFVEGETLAEWLADRNETAGQRQAAELIATLADAVAHAHQRGVLHRDLKPANVLLQKTDSTLRPLIADFGLAKLLDGNPSQTQTEAIVGTPAYMSPEQARGARDHGPATDVYALGAILYELITGKVPFDEDTILDTLNAVQQKEPTPPKHINPAVPADLDAICLMALQKEPGGRYATANDLNRDLRRFLDGEPVVARAVTRIQRVSKWCRRNPGIAGVSAIALFFLVASLAATTIGWLSTTSALDQARNAKNEADRRYFQNKEMVDNYFTQISENKILRSPGLLPLRQELMESALAYYTKFVEEQTDDDTLAADLEDAHWRIGIIQTDLGKFGEANSNFREALDWLDIQAEKQGATRELVARRAAILTNKADVQKQVDDPKRSLGSVNEAIELLEQLVDNYPNDSDLQKRLAFSYSVRADVEIALGNTENSQNDLRLAIETLSSAADESTFDETSRDRLGTWQRALATNLIAQGNVEEAEKVQLEVIAQFRQLVHEHPESLSDSDNLARTLGEHARRKLIARQPEEAVPFLEEAESIFLRLCLIHPQNFDYQLAYATTCSNLASCHDMLGDLDASEILFRRTLEANINLAKIDPSSLKANEDLATAHMNLAVCFAKQRKLDQAVEQFELAIPALQHMLTRTPNSLNARIRMGLAYMNLGGLKDDLDDTESAMEVNSEALSLFTNLFHNFPGHPQIPSFLTKTHSHRAQLFDKLQSSDKAIEHWDEALKHCNEAKVVEFTLKKARSMILANQHRAAEVMVTGLFAQTTSGSNDELLVAQVYALLATAVAADDALPDTEELTRKYKIAALEALYRAEADGELEKPEHVEMLTSSDDFHVLSDIEGFQQLLDRVTTVDDGDQLP